MASWNSYAPLWWQSLYQPSQVDENELPDLDALSQLDGARQHPLEARRKTAGSVSLVGNIAGLPQYGRRFAGPLRERCGRVSGAPTSASVACAGQQKPHRQRRLCRYS